MAKIRCFRCNEFGHMRRDCENELLKKRTVVSEIEEQKSTVERIGVKRQLNEFSITENDKDVQQEGDPFQRSSQETRHELKQREPKEMNVITVEDNHDDEDPSLSIWQMNQKRMAWTSKRRTRKRRTLVTVKK
jgi:hypothetical protein